MQKSVAQAYNGLDTRVSRNAQTFLRDGAYVTDPVLSDGNAVYTPGISERRGGTTTFQHSGLKNADAHSSVGQTLTATQQFDAYGNVASSSGSWQGPFGYGGGFGYQTETDSGLMLLGHRYLDPGTGRFLTRDPVKDGRNWYGYVGNNPTRWVDPSGLIRLWDMEFNAEVWADGLDTGLHGAISGLTFGAYDGGVHKDEIGFGGAQTFGKIGSGALVLIVGAKIAGITGYFWSVKNGFGGMNIIHRGVELFRFEIQQWGRGVPRWKWPHYHIRQTPQHRPWE